MNITQTESPNIITNSSAISLIILEDSGSIIVTSNDNSILASEDTHVLSGLELVTVLTEEIEVPYAKRVDFESSDTIIYQGWANPGSQPDQAVWRISRVTFLNSQGDTNTEWADGNANFDNIWDNRLSLSYS